MNSGDLALLSDTLSTAYIIAYAAAYTIFF
jgi:hypothetical protein